LFKFAVQYEKIILSVKKSIDPNITIIKKAGNGWKSTAIRHCRGIEGGRKNELSVPTRIP